jgi:tetratricopeptide (TPR) repeat protein
MDLRAAVNPQNPRSQRRWQFLLAAALVAVTLLAYLPVMRNGFIWDDDQYVTGNSLLRRSNGLRRIWLEPRSAPQYYPLVFTSFRIEYALWGRAPAGYHVVNILLHAANALLLWRILAFLGVPAGWLAALIFAVHPVNLETVAWVTERKNLLSGFFYLASLRAALRFYLGGDCEGARRWAAYGGALLLFVCALLSKTVTCTLPVVIGLILWWKRGRISWRAVLTLLPFLAIGAALALNTAWLEKTRVGAAGPEWNLSFMQRILIAGRVPWFYLSKLVWPHPLIFFYPRWTVDSAAAWQYLFPIATLSALAALWLLRRRIGRGPLAAAGFFAVTLAPALGFVNYFPMRFSFVADHFQYLASIGPIALAVAAIARWCARYVRWAAAGCACAAVAAFAVIVWCQSPAYKDAETLMRDTVRKNPTAWMAWNNLAVCVAGRAMAEQRPEEARKLFEEAIGYCDKAVAVRPEYAEAYATRADVYRNLGQRDLALRDFDRALDCRPDYAESWLLRGRLFADENRLDQAMSDYDRALELRPNFAIAHFYRANAQVRLRRYADAAQEYTVAIAAKDDFAEAYGNRAAAYYFLKEYAKGLADAATCERLGGRPDPRLVQALTRAASRTE